MDKETRPTYIPSIRDPLQIERHTQIGSKGMEEDILCRKKKPWGSNVYTRQYRLKTKARTRDKDRPSNSTSG